jgi:CheY-like chemotaxis protein
MAKILVADDDQQMCALMTKCLSGEGHDITPAMTLRSAKYYYEILHPDLVITDDLDGGGIKWAMELHQAGQPVLVTSVLPGAEGVRRLTKPFSKFHLLWAVTDMLATRPKAPPT